MIARNDKGAPDRRREPREPVDIDARLSPGGLSCRIVDLSPHGARVRLAQAAVLPSSCILIEWSSGRAHEAHVAWRSGAEAGFRLTRSCDLRGMVPAAFVAARALWAARG